jgi:hypothetical protein
LRLIVVDTMRPILETVSFKSAINALQRIFVLGLVIGSGWIGCQDLRGGERNPTSQGSPVAPAADENPNNLAAEPVIPKAPDAELEGKDIKDRAPFHPWDNKNPEEAHAYWHTVILAHSTSAEIFANSTRRDITFAHLFQEPEKYRGEVVHYEGRMTRVRRFEPPRDIKSAYDLPYYYEGWIFDAKVHGANPMCVIFTELAPGIEVKEKLEKTVAFDGYFFKTWRYTGGDHERISPILIGKRPILKKPEETAITNTTIAFSSEMITALLGMVTLVVTLVISLGVWYRRGDRRIKTRIAEANAPALFENDRPLELPGEENSPHNNGNRIER